MTAAVRQLLGLAVAIVSFVGSIIICALPQWRVIKICDSQAYQGLWKVCVTPSMHSTECKAYDGVVILFTPELAGARALIVIAIIVGVIGILLGAAGTKFINFVPDKRKKSKMAVASGVMFLIAGFFVLISVCWITNTMKGNSKNIPPDGFLKKVLEASLVNEQSIKTMIGNLDNVPPDGSPKSKLGASVYIGWITTVLLFLGGGVLCSSLLRRDGIN